MAYSSGRAIDRGGWFIALGVLFILIGVGALFTGAVSAVALWLSLAGRLHE